MNKLLMGNEAIALGAIRAGVQFVSGYPGTPSTETLETVAKYRTSDMDLYVEWSVNEKAAMEAAAGASYSGARVLVTMKQVGLNVASDPLMSLEYVGINGGFVILVADDPGPISSQTEQDTRHFAKFSKIPALDPATPLEAYEMVQEAFELSEKYKTPVFLRTSTRVNHACQSIEIDNERYRNEISGFKKGPNWVIFPGLTRKNHVLIEARNEQLRHENSKSRFNTLNISEKAENKRLAFAAGGVSFAYFSEAVKDAGYELGDVSYLKVGTPYPFPEDIALSLLKSADEVMVFEELDPVIETELTYIAGKFGIAVKIRGKLTGDVPNAGELSAEIVSEVIDKYFGGGESGKTSFARDLPDRGEAPDLPVRPPVLCAGCPHRASFYAVKQAMKGQKAVFCGDIGCYTLGNAKPLDMVDTCLCMGADITIAQGIQRVSPDTKTFAFIGDSTFFASGITGVVNAVYNEADEVICVLDNSTTAMTGQQPHPGTGVTMMGEITEKVDIEAVLKGVGVGFVKKVDPMNHKEAVLAVKEAAAVKGVSALIFKSPCVSLFRSDKQAHIDEDKCIGCRKCINEIGCPGLYFKDGKAHIDEAQCNGCGLCTQICPVSAIDIKKLV